MLNLSLKLNKPNGNQCNVCFQFGQLIQIQKRLGKEKFPLIEQCFYPNYKEMVIISCAGMLNFITA